MESLQHKIDRIRKPRVQITYDVEIGDAIEKKELAFVVGILADLSGHREDDVRPLPIVRKRKFVEIDRDNFGHVMEAIRPHLHLVVPNHLDTKEAERAFDYYFTSLDDFNPLNLVKRDGSLKALYNKRTALKDFLVKMDGNDPLEELVRQIISDPKARADLKTQVGTEMDKMQKEKANTATASVKNTPTTTPATPNPTGGK